MKSAGAAEGPWFEQVELLEESQESAAAACCSACSSQPRVGRPERLSPQRRTYACRLGNEALMESAAAPSGQQQEGEEGAL